VSQRERTQLVTDEGVSVQLGPMTRIQFDIRCTIVVYFEVSATRVLANMALDIDRVIM
jgi:hypothetical protein